MEESKILSTLEEIKAFSEPYRLQILNCFYNIGEPATVKQVADEMGEVPANVHYHVKKLEKTGILKLVFTREINGIVAKYYEPSAKMFNIESKEIGEPILKAVKNETQKLVSNAYRNSLEAVVRNIDNTTNSKSAFAMSLEELYLTDEEFSEFKIYISDFCNKHNSNKKCGEGSRKFHLFQSIRIND
jgi:DNA-binding transcriptional ArsR family regulator